MADLGLGRALQPFVILRSGKSPTKVLVPFLFFVRPIGKGSFPSARSRDTL